MKKITMTKYGFIRNEREDFSDDGSRFQGYMTSPNSRLRISKHVSNGRAYLSSSMNGNKLDYNEYSKLPHYQEATCEYNGIDMNSLTDEDLVDFYKACVEYEKEYIEAESKVVFPTIEEIRNQCIRIRKLRQQELNNITKLINENGTTLLLGLTSDYELRSLRDYYKNLKRASEGLDPDLYPQTIQKSNYGRNFVKETNSDLKENWYYRQLKEIISKVAPVNI
jgi:hypothetical protein